MTIDFAALPLALALTISLGVMKLGGALTMSWWFVFAPILFVEVFGLVCLGITLAIRKASR